MKLAAHLAQATSEGTLYIFDEPTTGLHFDDIAKLLDAFERLLRSGASILIIEHNLEVIRRADWVIDLGPEGGDARRPHRGRRHAGADRRGGGIVYWQISASRRRCELSVPTTSH